MRYVKFGHSRSLLTTCQQWWLNPTHEPKEAESGLLPALTGRSGSINDSEVLQMFATKWIGIGTSEKKSIKLTLPGIIIGLPRNCQNCFRCKSENWLHEDSRECSLWRCNTKGNFEGSEGSSPRGMPAMRRNLAIPTAKELVQSCDNDLFGTRSAFP